MKLCPNCHRLSKDDDFCSFCGNAVYDDNSESSIDCSQIPGHTHEKQTFTENTTYTRQNSSYNKSTSTSPEATKKGKGCLNLIILIIAINVLADVFFGGISELFEFLENILNEI
ncbi:MAG: hypothetical protein ACI4RH_03785 [Huintestinicola sp.]